jgi:hypothetical protein
MIFFELLETITIITITIIIIIAILKDCATFLYTLCNPPSGWMYVRGTVNNGYNGYFALGNKFRVYTTLGRIMSASLSDNGVYYNRLCLGTMKGKSIKRLADIPEMYGYSYCPKTNIITRVPNYTSRGYMWGR